MIFGVILAFQIEIPRRLVTPSFNSTLSPIYVKILWSDARAAGPPFTVI